MPSLDPSRYVYSPAGTLLAGEWTAAGIKDSLRRPPVDRRLRAPKFTERVLGAFPARPAFKSLVGFLRKDAGLARALARAPIPAASFSRHKPRMDAPPSRLVGITLPDLPTEAALAKWFGVGPQHLRWRADVTGRNRKHPPGPLRTYRYRWMKKRDGAARLLEIPKATLKQMQRKILVEILGVLPVHPSAHGFCTGRSIATNALPHCGKSIVLRLDLADFFPSVTSARVFRIFRTLGYPIDVARPLMGLCTTSVPADIWEARPGAQAGAEFARRQRLITRHLPQGAPTSPALANLAAHRLDRRLAALAMEIGATYTRYADDLAFSGAAELARSRKRVATLVAVIADDEGFALNHRKTRIMRAGTRQRVAGVIVNVRPNIARADFDRLKAVLVNCARHGPTSQNREHVPDFRAHLSGKIAHVRSINLHRGDKLLTLFKKIAW